jgi:hypothetical protein
MRHVWFRAEVDGESWSRVTESRHSHRYYRNSLGKTSGRLASD